MIIVKAILFFLSVMFVFCGGFMNFFSFEQFSLLSMMRIRMQLIAIPYFVITGLIALVNTFLFFKYDRADLNSQTKQFYKNYKSVHKSIYMVCICLVALDLILVMNECADAHHILTWINLGCYTLTLLVALIMRIKNDVRYGVTLAIAWLLGVQLVAGIVVPFSDGTAKYAIANVLLILFYMVFFYRAVRKQ